jgi:hypothetical protein
MYFKSIFLEANNGDTKKLNENWTKVNKRSGDASL